MQYTKSRLTRMGVPLLKPSDMSPAFRMNPLISRLAKKFHECHYKPTHPSDAVGTLACIMACQSFRRPRETQRLHSLNKRLKAAFAAGSDSKIILYDYFRIGSPKPYDTID